MDNIFVSGRIEFLGKHTDYCGGRSLVCGIDQGFFVDIEPRSDNLIRVSNIDTKDVIEFLFDENLSLAEWGWGNYPKTVAKRIAQNFKSRKLVGVNISFSSNLPQAAGVSSSSSFVVATFLAISRANDLPEFEEYKRNIRDQFDLGNYLGCLENGYTFRDLSGNQGVGTFGGSQDQTAIICCRENHLSRFSFCPVRHEADLRLPGDLAFVIASSGVAAEKTGAAKERYNRLSLLSREIIRRFDHDLSLAQNIEKYGFDEVKSKLDSRELVDRLTQFYTESYTIIPEISGLLQRGETKGIGELIDLSHRNADKLLGNQTSETNFLQESARNLGAAAASAFGAGFGGSVYALINMADAEYFQKEWQSMYLECFPEHIGVSQFFITRAGASRF